MMSLGKYIVLATAVHGQRSQSTSELLTALLKVDAQTLYDHMCNNMNFSADPLILSGGPPFQKFVVKECGPDLMDKLIGKGASAVDELLAHLHDARASQLESGVSPWSTNYVFPISDEGKLSPAYDWGFETESFEHAPKIKEYRFTAADIAYYAIC